MTAVTAAPLLFHGRPEAKSGSSTYRVDTMLKRGWLDGGVVREKTFVAKFARHATHEREVRRHEKLPTHTATPLPNEQQQIRRSARATHSGSTPC